MDFVKKIDKDGSWETFFWPNLKKSLKHCSIFVTVPLILRKGKKD